MLYVPSLLERLRALGLPRADSTYFAGVRLRLEEADYFIPLDGALEYRVLATPHFVVVVGPPHGGDAPVVVITADNLADLLKKASQLGSGVVEAVENSQRRGPRAARREAGGERGEDALKKVVEKYGCDVVREIAAALRKAKFRTIPC